MQDPSTHRPEFGRNCKCIDCLEHEVEELQRTAWPCLQDYERAAIEDALQLCKLYVRPLMPVNYGTAAQKLGALILDAQMTARRVRKNAGLV